MAQSRFTEEQLLLFHIALMHEHHTHSTIISCRFMLIDMGEGGGGLGAMVADLVNILETAHAIDVYRNTQTLHKHGKSAEESMG